MEFIQPFIDATFEVMDTQVDLKVTCDGPTLKKPEDIQDVQIIGTIALVSDVFTGNISLCFPEQSFLNIVSQMLGEEYTELDDEISDAVSEILNIIFGMAKAELNDQFGHTIQKAIPSVIVGSDIQVRQTESPGIALHFKSELGHFHMEIDMADEMK